MATGHAPEGALGKTQQLTPQTSALSPPHTRHTADEMLRDLRPEQQTPWIVGLRGILMIHFRPIFDPFTWHFDAFCGWQFSRPHLRRPFFRLSSPGPLVALQETKLEVYKTQSSVGNHPNIVNFNGWQKRNTIHTQRQIKPYPSCPLVETPWIQSGIQHQHQCSQPRCVNRQFTSSNNNPINC